jgi:hypothetical protein
MSDLEKRRNGLFTCLDCSKVKTQNCFACKNWNLFDVDNALLNLSYAEKSDMYAKKSGGIG